MSENLEQSVIEATMRVFETSTFMNIYPFEEDLSGSDSPEMAAGMENPGPADLEQPNIAATMNFQGPQTGKLSLAVAQKVLTELAMNMLGEFEEGESPDEKGKDALKEILNMICGNLLTLWYGEDLVFNLSPPEILDSDAESGKLPEITGVHVPFNIEDTFAEVIVEQK
jgi:CheY-specific phosphatase CheX